jgi:hypothetical protein
MQFPAHAMSRRAAMKSVGLVIVGAGGFWQLTASAQRAAATSAADLTMELRQASTADAMAAAARAMRAGAGWQEVMGAVFLAGIHELRPGPLGGLLHAVMVIDSAARLATGLTDSEGRLAALWCLDDFKNSQQRERVEGDWVLPPPRQVAFRDAVSVRRELAAALKDWDQERADLAISSLAPGQDWSGLRDEFLLNGARCFSDFGHKIIYAVQVLRALERLGNGPAQPALRSLATGLVYNRTQADVTEWETAQALAPRLPEGWRETSGPTDSERLLAGLRGRKPAETQRAVVEALGDGWRAKTVWEALRLGASDLFLRRPAAAVSRHLPVHPVTELNTLHHAWKSVPGDDARRVLLLQAAGWLSRWEGVIRDRYGPLNAPAATDPDPAEERLELPAVMEQADPGTVARWSCEDAARQRSVMDWFRRSLFSRANQNHQLKYAAAIDEESSDLGARWGARILSPAVTYLPGKTMAVTERWDRSISALKRAGLMRD